MSRDRSGSRRKLAVVPRGGGEPPANDAGEVAECIGFAALDLAKLAQAAGLTTLRYLLECAALEAGAQTAARQWPADAPKTQNAG